MAKFEGLIWKTGDDGWKDIPVGIGYVSKDFDPVNDAASMRVEDAVKAGYGGKSVDFRNVNDLLTACPPEGTVSVANPPKVIYAAVHPTNLKAAIIVWSAPVILLDPSKIAGGAGVSLNGRVMTVNVSPVKIDGSDSQSIDIEAGAVGAYGSISDPNQPRVTDTTSKMYAGTQNDTSVGDDQSSQTSGQDIALFVPCQHETVTVSVSFTYKMEDAMQTCGEPHKIWGASYCVWGTTTPMETFPFGTVMDIDPASLSPESAYYGGTVASSSYVDRGSPFEIGVAGVAGPTIKLASVNDKALPLQPGQVVSFQSYLCSTICGVDKMTQIAAYDEALAYVDEDIIKPRERTFPVYTFLETTYYMTTMFAITTTEIPAMVSTQFPTTGFADVWRGTQVYGTAVQWSTDLKFPEGLISTIGAVVTYENRDLVIAPGAVSPYLAPGTDFYILRDPVRRTVVDAAEEFSARAFVHTPTDVVCRVFPATGKAVDGNAQGTLIRQVSTGTYAARFMPNPGAAVSGAIGTATLTLQSFNVDQVPTGGKVITSIGTTTLVVCTPGGSPTTITIVTSIGTAAADAISFQALTYSASIAVVTDVPTSPANEVNITTASGLPDVYVITSVPVLDPVLTTALTGTTQLLNATTAYVGDGEKGVAEAYALMATTYAVGAVVTVADVAVFAVTGQSSPTPIDLTKFSELDTLTAFDPASVDVLNVMAPVPNSTLTLPFLDTNKTIPILDVTGPEEKAVKLLISNTDGQMSMIGMTEPALQYSTMRTNKGACTPGSVGVMKFPSFYEADGQVMLLSPIPVQKAIGTADDCPCFTTSDPSGGPAPPTDNSALGAFKPCTMRVRRLQLRECHT